MLKDREERKKLFYIIYMAMAMVLAFSWQTANLDCDSYNYAVVSQQALKDGRWLNLADPICGGLFYYHFPLCIWVTAGFFKVLGVSLLSAKLFSMLCAVLACVAVFYLGKTIKNSWVGFFAAWSFLLTNHVVRLARQSRMDLPVTFFITMALFAFILAQRRNRKYYILFGIFSCLAVFSKDVTGTAPLPIAVLYLLLTRKFREIFSPLFLLSLGLAILPLAGWVALEKIIHGKSMFDLWLNWNFLHLATSPAFNVPWNYYLWVLVTKYWYFLPFAVWGGYLAVREEYRQNNKGWLAVVIWAVFLPFAFSFGRQKLHYFILPMYPAASLLTGLCYDKIFSDKIKEAFLKFVKYGVIIFTLLMLCLPLKLYKERGREYMALAPTVEKIIKESPDSEVLLCRVDKAAAMFHFHFLKDLEHFEDINEFEQKLRSAGDKRMLGCVSRSDFNSLSDDVRGRMRVILSSKDILLVSDFDIVPAVR